MIYSGSPVETPFPRSCLLLGCEQMTFSSVWSGDFVLIQLTSLLFFFRIHFEKLKQIPVLQLDASVEFQSDQEVQEQIITKVRFYFIALLCQRQPHEGPILIFEIPHSSFLTHTFSDLMFDVFLIHPFHAQVKKFFDALWADQHQLHDETSPTSVSREKEI